MTTYLIKSARILGGEPTDLLLEDGVIAEIGAGLDAGRRRGRRRRRASSRCPAWSTCTPTCASPAARTPRPSRPAPRRPRSAASPPCTRWPTPTRSPTPPASSSRSGGSAARPGTATSSRSARSPSGCGGERLAELGAMADSAARVRVFSDDGKCVSDAVLMRRALEYVKAFDGVVAQHAQEPRLTEDAQMNEGELSGRLGLRGWPAVAEEAIIARDCLLAAHVGSRLHVCHVSHRRVGRDRPLGQEQGLERHRRGVPAPPAAHRRARGDVRPDLQGQPAAALGRRRRGAARRAGRRHHRRRRHRPRAAPARGQGLRVAGRRVRHARPGDRAVDRAADDGRHRPDRLGRRRRADVRASRRRSAGSPATAARSRWGSPPTWCSTTRRSRQVSTAPSSPRSRGTRRTSDASCPDAWSRRSCAARPTVLDGKLA